MKLRNKKTGGLANILGKQDFFRVYTDAGWADYDTLAELNEEWEDYSPPEPLIKDEKIRKVVREWAEGNMVTKVQYDAFWRGFRNRDSSITVWEELPLEDNETYTIAELCGEEE